MYMVTMAMVVLFTLDFVDINLRDLPVCPCPSLPNFQPLEQNWADRGTIQIKVNKPWCQPTMYLYMHLYSASKLPKKICPKKVCPNFVHTCGSTLSNHKQTQIPSCASLAVEYELVWELVVRLPERGGVGDAQDVVHVPVHGHAVHVVVRRLG